MKELMIETVLPLTQTVGGLSGIYICTRVYRKDLDTPMKMGVLGTGIFFTSFIVQGVIRFMNR